MRTGKGWLILGQRSGARDHSLLVVELPWKITRGVLVSEADRTTEQDGHGFIRWRWELASIRIEFLRLITTQQDPGKEHAYPQIVTRTSVDGLRIR